MMHGLRKLNPVSKKYKQLFLEDLKNNKIKTEEVTSCICCGGNHFEKLLDIDRFGLPFGSYICTQCGLISTNPRIKQESLPYYYDTYYHPLNYGKEQLHNQSALFEEGQGCKIFHKIHPLIKTKNILHILEIGAGVGSVLDEFRAQAKKNGIQVELLGTEYSSECIEQCNKREIQAVQGDARSILALNKKFDLIILSHVFEHFIDLEEELSILKKLLHRDGLLYIEVPGILKNHTKSYYDFSFLGYTVHAHMYNFTLKTLNNIVSNRGFMLLKGNEEVEAVFQLSETQQQVIENDYLRIKHYLEFLEDNQQYAKKQHEANIRLSKESEQYKTQVQNRNKEIEKLKTQVANREKEILKYKTQVQNKNKEIEKLKIQISSLEQKINMFQNGISLLKSNHPMQKYKGYTALLKEFDANF